MEMPMIFNEKMLAGVDRQIRTLVQDPEMDGVELQCILWELCLTPWDVAEVFGLPYAEIADLMDRYRLKAVATSWDYANAIGPPDIPDWNKGFYCEQAVPLFSPLNVFKAWRRYQDGDVGVEPPPATCEIDEVLRSMWRRWSDSCENLDLLIAKAHDADLVSAALSPDCGTDDAQISALAKEHGIWMVGESLEGQKRRYWERYGATPLRRLRKVLGLSADGWLSSCRWVSPSIIPLIESSAEFRDTTNLPKWLLYKAVTIHKGQLPEGEHNRMLAEAVNQDKYVEAYFDFLKPPPAPAPPQPDPIPERDCFDELKRLLYP